MADNSEKVLENRVRRMADRQGYRLLKSRRRDPRAYDFGGYMIVDVQTGGAVYGSNPMPYSLSLQDALEWLEDDGRIKK